MGCYGIGISRLMGLLAEHFADDKGLNWPAAVAPFDVYLIRIGDEDAVTKAADDIYFSLTQAGVGVLYDDRDSRPGEMFADADLMGIPSRLVISGKTVAGHTGELKRRGQENTELIPLTDLVQSLAKNQ